MNRLVTLTLQYYRTLLIYNITFTVLCLFLIGFSAGNSIVSMLFSKLIGFAGAVALHYYSAGKTYFYYRNAGMYIRRLYCYASLIDIIILFAFIITASVCRQLF